MDPLIPHNTPVPRMDLPIPIRLRNHLFADSYHERVEKKMEEFSQSLKEDEAFSAEAVLNDGQRISISWVGYHNPNMLIIDGFDEAQREVRVLIPHTDAQIVMTKLAKNDVEDRPSIGFQSRTEESDREERP